MFNQTTQEQNISGNASNDFGGTGGSPLVTIIGLTVANIVSILCGTLGNALVIVSVVLNKGMRSTTNFFIASLAAADLIVTSVCMPAYFVYNVLVWPTWPFGTGGCRLLSYLVHMSVMASALSLLAISYDRFLSVFFPLRRFLTKVYAKRIVAVIWFVSPLLLLPSLFHHDIIPTIHKGKKAVMCVESWSTTMKLHAYQMYRISCYFLFVLQISAAYYLIGRRLYRRQQPGEQTSQSKAKALLSKRKTIKMLFLVVAMFALCWLPYITNKLLLIFPPEPNYKPPDIFVFIGNFLGLLNSVANPLIYALLNQNFRTAFKNALRCNCNYEVEERRRAISGMSHKKEVSTNKTQRTRCESPTADHHTISLSSGDNFVVPGQVDVASEGMKCLSFSSLDCNALVGFSGGSITRKNTSDMRRYSDKCRVSLDDDVIACTNVDQQKPIDGESEFYCQSEEINNLTGVQPRQRRNTDVSFLFAIEECGCNNESFEQSL